MAQTRVWRAEVAYNNAAVTVERIIANGEIPDHILTAVFPGAQPVRRVSRPMLLYIREFIGDFYGATQSSGAQAVYTDYNHK